jgi:tetraacyldisaccharide 4'-kinase
VIVITRKVADDQMVSATESALKREAPEVPIAVMRLSLSGIRPVGPKGAGDLPMTAIMGKRVAAVAAVGNPEAFFRQLEQAGATVTRFAFPDHHPFTRADIAAILSRAGSTDYVVSTLKDAVKLEPLWAPAASPLWYVSLAVQVERGDAMLDALLMRLQGRIVVK